MGPLSFFMVRLRVRRMLDSRVSNANRGIRATEHVALGQAENAIRRPHVALIVDNIGELSIRHQRHSGSRATDGDNRVVPRLHELLLISSGKSRTTKSLESRFLRTAEKVLPPTGKEQVHVGCIQALEIEVLSADSRSLGEPSRVPKELGIRSVGVKP